jgi:hypothetical protein
MAIVPIFFFILLAIDGGNIFVFVAEGYTNWWVLSSTRGALQIGYAEWQRLLGPSDMQDTRLQSKTPEEMHNLVLRSKTALSL